MKGYLFLLQYILMNLVKGAKSKIQYLQDKSVKMADDEIPPLEDMTSVLEQAKQLRDLKLSKECGDGLPTKQNHTQKQTSSLVSADEVKTSPYQISSAETPLNPSTATSAIKTNNEIFGGMKKGFLFASSKVKISLVSDESQASNTDNKEETKPDEIPLIKAKSELKDSSLKLSDVQAAMESSENFLKNKEWVTDDLLESVQRNDMLAKRMSDPRFMQAITEFQTNPQEAMVKYGNDKEIQLFLKEFCGLLGQHFSKLGIHEEENLRNPQQAKSRPLISEVSEDDQKAELNSQQISANHLQDPQVQAILSDPTNRRILMDPQIQELIQSLRQNPEKANRMIREADISLRQKLDYLISLGLLQFQT